jgi:hypothetical protein
LIESNEWMNVSATSLLLLWFFVYAGQ